MRKIARGAAWGAAVALTATLFSVVPNQAPHAADAAEIYTSGYATGGTGRFKGDINWFQWADTSGQVVIGNGSNQSKQVTNTRDLGGGSRLATTCTISNLSALRAENGTTATGNAVRLQSYAPGGWAGDGLDDLYNQGGTGHWNTANGQPGVFPNQYKNDNKMVIGLRNTADGAALQFDYSCSAALIDSAGQSQPIALQGLVFADAEASSAKDGYDVAKQSEWVQATTPGASKWRVLDRWRDSRCTTDVNANLSADSRTLRFIPDAQECVYANGGNYNYPANGSGPTSVGFVEGATSARVSLQGRGYSAVALGVVVSTDFGDAPETYGTAGALYQQQWSGNILAPGTTKVFSQAQLATLTDSSTEPILGSRIDAEGQPAFSDDAQGDDKSLTGTTAYDDEDGLNGSPLAQADYTFPSDLSLQQGSTYTLQGIKCSGGAGYVQGWIDWNGNGVFDPATEASNNQFCTANEGPEGTVDLSFKVPADASTTLTQTFLRLRISANSGVQQPVGTTVGGEVEDYLVKYPTRLQLNKQLDVRYGGENQPSAWSLNATAQSGGAVTNYTSGQIQQVASGEYVIGEVGKPGYQLAGVVCTVNGKPVDVTPDNHVDVTPNQLTICTLTNKDQPGTVTWQKTDADTGALLNGSEWKLTREGSSDSLDVTDNTGQSGYSGLDQDATAGKFSVPGLHWGTWNLEETKAPAGYQKIDGIATQFTVTADSLTPASVVVPNGLPVTINLQKLGYADKAQTDPQPIDGSSFSILADENGQPGDAATGVEVTSASGTGAFQISGLQSGKTYWLREDRAPTGHALLANPVSFTVTRDAAHPQGVVTLNGDHSLVNVSVGDDGTTTITVSDVRSVTLPIAGVSAAFPYLAIGLAILILSALALLERRRRG